MRYERYTRLYSPHLLLEDEITLPLLVLPMIRRYFGSQREETECRIIAYQMIYFMQLAFYRSDAFVRYTGIDLKDDTACDRMIDFELELFLPEVKHWMS